MRNKKLITMVASLALVAVVGIGATLAYFTDRDEATNVITMGHVDIDLEEPNFPGGPEGGEIENVVPGDEITKDPTVTVQEGSEDAYIRVKLNIVSDDVDFPAEYLAQLLAKNADGTYKYLNIDTTVWAEADGYFYYNQVVKAGQQVVLFDTVTIPAEWNNTVADKSFKIEITAEAIQADNVTPVEKDNMIVGWPEAVILEYTK